MPCHIILVWPRRRSRTFDPCALPEFIRTDSSLMCRAILFADWPENGSRDCPNFAVIESFQVAILDVVGSINRWAKIHLITQWPLPVGWNVARF